jgi:hypothetical protein
VTKKEEVFLTSYNTRKRMQFGFDSKDVEDGLFVFPYFQYINIDFCCSSHNERLLDIAKKTVNVKQVSLGVAESECFISDEAFRSVCTYLADVPSHIESVVLHLYHGNLSGCLSVLANLKDLQIEFVDFYCEDSEFVLSGVQAFPWESCKSVKFSELAIQLSDWRCILQRLRICEIIAQVDFDWTWDLWISLNSSNYYLQLSSILKLIH